MELYAKLIELNTYFVARLDDSYKKERDKIDTNDSPIKIYLTAERLKRFHNPILKEKYSKELYLNLRIVDIELHNGEIKSLLTNIPNDVMTIEDLCQIYDYSWGIETNYNTLKNRLDIENFSVLKRITIEQDIYSDFLFYNVFCYYNCYMNRLVNLCYRRKGKCGEEDEYKIDQSNLIRNLNEDILKVIVNPIKRNVSEFTFDLIWESTDQPNKIKNNREVFEKFFTTCKEILYELSTHVIKGGY